MIGMPRSRPMPSIGPGVHELRVRDAAASWRIFYRTDETLILVIQIVAKTIPKTPKEVIRLCQKRLKEYDAR